MSGRIGVVGSNMTDLITYGHRLPLAGETLEAQRFAVGRGGKGANQAVAASRLGANVVMVGRVGEDDFGRETLRSLQADGVDTTHILSTAGVMSGVAPIFVADSGENSIFIIKGANALLSPADIEAAANALLSCDLILLQLEIPLETVYATIDWARQHGRRVLLNPAPASKDLVFERIADVAYFVPNQTELAILTDMPTETISQVEKAANSLLQRGMRTIIVTLGAAGALLVTAAETKHIPPVLVAAKDTTGAGDAFIGSFAAYEVSGCSLDGALQRAVAYAALSVMNLGTQSSFADQKTFKSFLDQSGLALLQNS